MSRKKIQELPTDSNNFSVIDSCRLCKSDKLVTVMDFGSVPLANSYLDNKDAEELYYPLTVCKCDECGHVQLKETISPSILFTEYNYSSSDSPSLIKHFKEYASTVTSKLRLGEYDSILEIGSNDGILLKEFVKLGMLQLYGVEPASNIADRSMGIGAIIFNKFFDEHVAKDIKVTHGKMSVICANNVFAHVADIESMIKGIVDLLCDDGVFVFENAYLLDTIRGLYFDQVYHEHLQYYGIKPLVKYLGKFGLEIFDIERVNTQGGSFRIYAKFKTSSKNPVQPSVANFIKEEEDFNLYDFRAFSNFNSDLVTLIKRMKATIQLATLEGKTISCYGCPAKFALLSKMFGLNSKNIQYVVDDSPLKQGKFSPGKKIPIVSKEYFIEHPTDYCIISVWNMVEAIKSRNPEYSGQWIIPMPVVQILPRKTKV